WVALPKELRVRFPAFKILLPSTVRWVLSLKFRELPLASWRLSTVALMSKATLLVPFVMHTLVELLLGTPVGFQFEVVFQSLLPSFQVETVPVRVHWPKAAE